MPVSVFPVFLTALLLIVPFVAARFGARYGIRFGIISLSLFLSVVLFAYIPGLYWAWEARSGNGNALYRLAQWEESHSESIGQWFLWPFRPDVRSGYQNLEAAANSGYPPAIYALGVRLKYGQHVPKPKNWMGPAGNVFDQPERGQPLIDKALSLGFAPPVKEDEFYWQVFRRCK